jgi:hypothetical protein
MKPVAGVVMPELPREVVDVEHAHLSCRQSVAETGFVKMWHFLGGCVFAHKPSVADEIGEVLQRILDERGGSQCLLVHA